MKTLLFTTAILLSATIIPTLEASTGVTRVNTQHQIDCKKYTYSTTKTARQALHHKGLHTHAQLIVRLIEACENQANGGFSVQQTQDLHYKNDAEINQRRNMHYYSQQSKGRY